MKDYSKDMEKQFDEVQMLQLMAKEDKTFDSLLRRVCGMDDDLYRNAKDNNDLIHATGRQSVYYLLKDLMNMNLDDFRKNIKAMEQEEVYKV